MRHWFLFVGNNEGVCLGPVMQMPEWLMVFGFVCVCVDRGLAETQLVRNPERSAANHLETAISEFSPCVFYHNQQTYWVCYKQKVSFVFGCQTCLFIIKVTKTQQKGLTTNPALSDRPRASSIQTDSDPDLCFAPISLPFFPGLLWIQHSFFPPKHVSNMVLPLFTSSDKKKQYSAGGQTRFLQIRRGPWLRRSI